MSQQNSPLDQHQKKIEKWASSGLSNTAIANKVSNELGIKTSEASIRRALKRWNKSNPSVGFEQPYFKVDQDKATIVTSVYMNDTQALENLVRSYGLDPDEWQIEKPTFTIRETEDGISQQAKITLTRIEPYDAIIPARVPSDYRRPQIKKDKKLFKKGKDAPELVVFVGDQQAPYHDQDLHEKFCQWLADYQPSRGVLIGDTIDLPTISRHAPQPSDASVQECIDTGYQLLRDYVESSESTNWVKLEGNHDYRLRRAVIDNLREFYGIRRGRGRNELAENPLLDVAHLLRLDELGIEYLRTDGDWKQVQYQVSPKLAARHGWVARKGSGASALATLEHLGYSVIVGHTHRQSLVYKTKHDIDGTPSTITGVETGCMCRVAEGLGYAVAPDWLNGFATARVWPDGKFKIDLATYVDGVLYYGDTRYE